MIISHKHKFIFIKTEKTASTSIEIALSKICGPEDIITPITLKDELKRKEFGFQSAQNYLIPFSKYKTTDWLTFLYKRKRITFYNHISAAEIKKYLDPEIWNTYFKFCFERNPWDKLISYYYWYSAHKKNSSMQDFIRGGYAKKLRSFELYTESGIPIVDMIGRFETIEKDLAYISKKLHLQEPITLTSYKAKGDVRKNKNHYSEILNSAEADFVATTFKREIDLLGYKF